MADPRRSRSQSSKRSRALRIGGITAALVIVLVAAFWLLGDHSGITLPAYAYRHQHIEEAYRFALRHRDLLAQVPCACGCDAIGHRSNADCYIKEIRGNQVAWDPHGAG